MDELYVAGFNGLGQLTGQKTDLESVSDFQKIAQAGNVRVLFSGFGRTMYADDQEAYTLGVPNNCLIPVPTEQVRCVFGTDEAGMLGIVTTDDQLYCSPPENITQKPRLLQQCKVRTRICNEPSCTSRINFLAISGSGRAACTYLKRRGRALSTFIVSTRAFTDLVAWDEIANPNSNSICRFARSGLANQLLANALAFTLLMHDGTVYTWGDPRYGSLGRQQDEGFDIPSRVRVLDDCKIRKIASGGFLTAALTEDGRLFMWGVTRPGGSQLATSARDEPVALQRMTGSECPTIVDVAIGDNHVVALASDGTLFGLGEGASGELGNACQATENFAASWSRITTMDGKIVKSIACGRQSTFLICDGSGDPRRIVPSGDAVQIVSSPDNQLAADSRTDGEGLPNDEDESETESAGSDLPMEGPEDWFR